MDNTNSTENSSSDQKESLPQSQNCNHNQMRADIANNQQPPSDDDDDNNNEPNSGDNPFAISTDKEKNLVSRVDSAPFPNLPDQFGEPCSLPTISASLAEVKHKALECKISIQSQMSKTNPPDGMSQCSPGCKNCCISCGHILLAIGMVIFSPIIAIGFCLFDIMFCRICQAREEHRQSRSGSERFY